MKIQILGSGCANCKKLEANAREALQIAKIQAEIQKITDFAEIAKFGVLRTPGIARDGKVLSSGKVLTSQEIVALLTS